MDTFNAKKFAQVLARNMGQDARKVARQLRGFRPKQIMFWETSTQYYTPHAINAQGYCVSYNYNLGVRVGGCHDIPTVPTDSVAAAFGKRLHTARCGMSLHELSAVFMQSLVQAHPNGFIVCPKYPDILACRFSTFGYADECSINRVYADKSSRLASQRAI